MEFWIIRDGEKAGPFADYELRSKIDADELGPDDPIWHDGLEGWKPLREITRFAGAFDHPPAVPPPLPRHALPPISKNKIPVGRRFWARMFDLNLYGALWWGGLWLAGVKFEALSGNVWLILFQLVPWVLFEAALIHRFGTTPGKAILGIRVTNADGSRLEVGQSFTRAIRVYLSGIGLGVSYLFPICLLINWGIARNLGFTLWDRSGGHVVHYRELQPWRVITIVPLFFVCIGLQMPMLMQAPEMKEAWEKARRDVKEAAQKR